MERFRVTRRTARAARILLAVFAVLLVLVVLTPSQGNGALDLTQLLAQWVASWGLPYGSTFYAVEFLANIALFVPVGVLVPLACGSMRPGVLVLAVLLGFAVSLGIEFAQMAIPGRVSDPRDLLSNTLGAVAGVVLLLLVRTLFGSRPARAA